MNKYLMLCIFSFVIVSGLYAEGMEFFQGTWAEALQKSQESGKIIFVDAYTTWCGPCKKMSAETFPDEKVGEFYNANFINIKMDMEKGEGLKFARTYGVSAYPSLFFIAGDAKMVMKSVGYLDAPKFLAVGKSALGKNDKSGEYAKEYNAGKRDFNTVYNYVKALNQAGKSSLKIANDYINSQKDLTSDENLQFILEAASDLDSRIFDLLIKHKPLLVAKFKEPAVTNRINAAAKKTLSKAIEFKSLDLLLSAQSKYKEADPSKSDLFTFQSNLEYFSAMNDAENLLKAVKKIPTAIESDPNLMNLLAISIEKTFPSDSKLLSLAESNLTKVVKSNPQPDHLYTLARIYLLNNKKEQSLKMIDQSILLAKTKGDSVIKLEEFRNKIQSS